jgi:hypothetical protein
MDYMCFLKIISVEKDCKIISNNEIDEKYVIAFLMYGVYNVQYTRYKDPLGNRQ